MNTLLPCPFCGSNPIVNDLGRGQGLVVYCSKCLCQTSQYGDFHAIDKWNYRVNEVQMLEEINHLRNIAGDNLCHLSVDDIAYLKQNPTKIPPWHEFGESCHRFHTDISGEVGVLDGCKTIAQLEKENKQLREMILGFLTLIDRITNQ